MENLKHSQGVNSIEIKNDHVYWVARTGDPTTKKWKDQLFFKKIESRQKEKLFTEKNLAFKVSPNERTIALTRGPNIYLLDLESRKLKLGSKLSVCKKKNPVDSRQFELEAWSNDSTMIIFSCATYDNGVTIGFLDSKGLHYYGFRQRSDYALEPGNGRVAGSSLSLKMTVLGPRRLLPNEIVPSELYLIDFKSGKNITLARSDSSWPFHQQWNSDSSLEDFMKDKKITLSKDQILDLLKK